jgi:hypothetical protein
VKEQVNDKSGSVAELTFESGYASDDYPNEFGSKTINNVTVVHVGNEPAPSEELIIVCDLTGSKKSSDPPPIFSAETYILCKKDYDKKQGSRDRKAWKQKKRRQVLQSQ